MTSNLQFTKMFWLVTNVKISVIWDFLNKETWKVRPRKDIVMNETDFLICEASLRWFFDPSNPGNDLIEGSGLPAILRLVLIACQVLSHLISVLVTLGWTLSITALSSVPFRSVKCLMFSVINANWLKRDIFNFYVNAWTSFPLRGGSKRISFCHKITQQI